MRELGRVALHGYDALQGKFDDVLHIGDRLSPFVVEDLGVYSLSTLLFDHFLPDPSLNSNLLERLSTLEQGFETIAVRLPADQD